jgi:hypothetical protein
MHVPVNSNVLCDSKSDTHNGPIGYYLYNNADIDKPKTNTAKQTGPFDHFLLNSDFINVMQELHTTVAFCKNAHSNTTNPETVFNFGGSAPSAVAAVASSATDIKNCLHNNPEHVTQTNIVPTIRDSESTINAYLNRSFPSYSNVGIPEVYDPVVYELEYKYFPIFKTTFRDSENKSVSFKSNRPDWEPYKWFFSQIQWSTSCENKAVTFCELAIAAHILTGGATAQGQDLYTKSCCIPIAMKRYYLKKYLPGNSGYKQFFNTHCNIRTISMLGAESMSGVKRFPVFIDAPDIMHQVRNVVWKVAQSRQLANSQTRFGEGYFIKTGAISKWIPDSVIWIYRTLEESKNRNNPLQNASTNDSSVSLSSLGPSFSASCVPVIEKNAHIINLISSASACEISCFYGHKVSSSTDMQGREQWRFSPNPPWPGVPPARPLCQRCYLYHRASALRGESQYSFAHLFCKQKSSPTLPSIGGASSSTERPPG